jgi:tetratricopeptide (TPR) repeat protein
MRNCFFHKLACLAVIGLLQGCLLFQPPGPAQFPDRDASLNRSMLAAYHYSLGVLNLLNENSAEAISEYEKARQFDPESQLLAAELAILYGERGSFEKALALLNDALKSYPGDVEMHFLRAGLYANIKDHTNTVHAYQSVIALDPKHISAHLYLGTAYAEQKDFQNALDTIRKLLAIDPDHVIGHYYLAKILTELKQDDEAEKEFKKAIDIRPSFESAMADLGALYEKQKKYALAILIYDDITKTNPSRVRVRIRMGDLLLREKRNAEADQVFGEILRQQASNKEIALTIGLIYLERERPDRAVDLFEKLHASYPDDQKIRYLLAAAYSEKSQNPQALEMFARITPDSDFYVNARTHAATILKKEGKPDEAVKAIREAIAVKTDAPGLYVFLSSLYDGNKDYTHAEKVLRDGLDVLPKSMEILYSIGLLYEKTGRFEDGIKHMRQILAIDPDHADALNFIGYSYADRNIRLDEAEELIKKAMQLKPGNAYIIDSLGWVYFRQNRMERAIELLMEAIRLQPDDVAISEHLGDAYVQNGQFKEALDLYQKTLKLNPDSKTLPGKISDLLKK